MKCSWTLFQYKTSLYNLVDKAAPGPSRSTRRTRTEQEQLLKTASSSAHLSPSALPLSTKRQPKVRADISTNSVTLPEAAKSSGSKAKAKGSTEERSSERVNASFFDDDGPLPREDTISSIVIERHPHNDDKITSRPTKKRKLAGNKGYDSISVESRRSGRLQGHNEKVIVTDKPVEAVTSSVIFGPPPR